MMKQRDKLFLLGSDLRTIAGLALTFASLIALLMLASCAPKPVERQYPVGRTDFGPLQKDPDLKLDKLHTAAVPALKWNETVSSARLFRFAENVINLGQMKQSPALVKLGTKVGTAFYNAHDTATHTDFNNALYLTAAVGETKEDVMPVLDQNDEMLADQLPLIRDILKSSAATYPWPTTDTQPKASLAMAKIYVQQFLERASQSKINPDVYSGIESAVNTDFYPLVEGLSKEIDAIMAEPDSVAMIDHLKAVAKQYDFSLGDDTMKQLDQARAVFIQIKAIDSNQDALTVIVELWEMTDPENRQKTFEPVSKDLYDFLKNKGPSDLRCIKSKNCLNPFILIPKMIGLKPAIQKYGLERLKTDITAAAHDSLVKQITAAVASFVPTIPQELDDKITAQLQQIRDKIASVKKDYGSFIHGIAKEFLIQDMKQTDPVRLAGLESNRVQIALSSGSVTVSAALNAPQTGAEVIGDSMAYAASLWNIGSLSPLAYTKSVVQQVDKMLALGGFETPSKKPYASLAVSVDPSVPFKHFSIREDIGGKVPFAVPDSFAVAQDLTPTISESAGKNVSVKAQAELLRGLAAMTRYFRDWQKNGFDDSLGAVQVGHLIKDLPAGSVTSGLFPKDSFFALGVANAATILTNMTKQLSPVFLIDITRKTTWANDRSDDSDQPATMAGVVDIVGGKRSSTVHMVDAARFLLAIADFLEATEGIENTQSHPLVTPSADTGKRPVDQLVEARTSLSMLIVGIANFISHEMASQDGGIRATFAQDMVQVSAKEPRKATDQAFAILALVRAGEVLDKTIYEATALDAYAFMNTKLFNPKTGFYNSGEDTTELPSPDEMAVILLAGERLRSHMSNASRDQWDMLSAPWVKALEGLN